MLERGGCGERLRHCIGVVAAREPLKTPGEHIPPRVVLMKREVEEELLATSEAAMDMGFRDVRFAGDGAQADRIQWVTREQASSGVV